MRFCPKCGTLMIIKNEEYLCSKCNYSEKAKKSLVIKEKIKKEDHIEVIINEENAYPVSEETICPKCGEKGAYYFFKQTRSSDEAETRFFKCVHCAYVWREYD